MANVLSYEIRQTSIGNKRIRFPVYHIDIPSSNLFGSVTQVYVYEGSILESIVSALTYSPIPYYTTYPPTDAPTFKNTSVEIFRGINSGGVLTNISMRYNNLVFNGVTGMSSGYHVLPFMMITTDNKKFFGLYNVYENNYTQATFVPSTDNKFGYCVLPQNETERFWLSVGGSSSQLNTYLNAGEEIYSGSTEISNDPYDEGGTSTGNTTGGGGGTGDFDDTSDTIGVPSLPSESGLNTGFFTAFVCSPTEMRNISSYLWNNAIQDILDQQTGFGDKLDALKKIVGNPYDAIMGCSLIPVSPTIGGTKEMKMYGVLETGISLSYASSRWVEVDCGTLNVHEFWGGYLDYSPYSKTTSLYLPFIGVVSIDIDLIMNKALQVVYHVDILSGICIAFIVVDGSVKFQYQGHCSTTIPVTSADYSGSIQAGLGLVGNIANVVTSGVGGAMTGGIAGAVSGAVGSAMSQAPSIASNVMGMKPDIKSGGGVGSSGGILSVKKPYLIIERPRQSLPERQNTFTGYPCNVTMSVGECSGYTEYETIKLDNLFLTEEEKNELTSILQGGAYL